MMSPELLTTLNRIKHVARTTKLKAVETVRATRNLDAIADRIEQHDYLIASYADNKFNVPERIKDFFKELEFHSSLGRTWERVFDGIALKKNLSVLDLCPGAFPKVELGLHYAGFKGNVYILDLDMAAIKKAKEFLGLFDPSFKVHGIKADAMKYRARQFDMVVANHMLDDLTMNYVCEARKLRLDDVYAKEKNLLAVWDFALGNREEVKAAVVPPLLAALNRLTKRGGTTVLTQYPSYMERQLKLKDVTMFNASLLNAVAQGLSEYGFSDVSGKALRGLERFKGIFGPKHCRVLRK